MLLAIDVGNTDTKFGFNSGAEWIGIWRRPTESVDEPTEVATWLKDNLAQAEISDTVEATACACVVPSVEAAVSSISLTLSGKDAAFLNPGAVGNLKVFYEPQNSVGADRIANVLGALRQYKPPLIVVDFGTATTLDICTPEGFIGGAILPGVKLQMSSLSRGTSKLFEVATSVPQTVIGQSTEAAIQSGVVLGQVAAVEGLVARMQAELPAPATVLGTGGLSHLFVDATKSIHHFLPTLTLDGVLAVLG